MERFDPMDNLEEQFKPPEFDHTVYGLPLPDTEEIGVPMDALVLVKSYIKGEPCYRIVSTENLTSVECVGMLRWAEHQLLNAMWWQPTDAEDEDEEEDDGLTG